MAKASPDEVFEQQVLWEKNEVVHRTKIEKRIRFMVSFLRRWESNLIFIKHNLYSYGF